MKQAVTDSKQLEQLIQAVLRAIDEAENPLEISAYKKFFQKHVPLTRRSYVAAYLLKHKGVPKDLQIPFITQSHEKNTLKREKLGGKRIFINIGRQQGATPRDFRNFFESAQGIEKKDIKHISIHRNFSFVTLQVEKIQTAITALDGKELKGKKLSVSIARKQA